MVKDQDVLEISLVAINSPDAETERALRTVTQTVQHIPKTINRKLASAGVHIAVTPTISQALPELRNKKPWTDMDATYESVPAIYIPETKTIYVAARWKDWTMNSIANNCLNRLGYAYHELTGIANSSEFSNAIAEDLLDPPEDKDPRYDTATLSKHRAALFSAFFALAILPGTDAPTQEDLWYLGMARVFPRSFSMVQETLADRANNQEG